MDRGRINQLFGGVPKLRCRCAVKPCFCRRAVVSDWWRAANRTEETARKLEEKMFLRTIASRFSGFIDWVAVRHLARVANDNVSSGHARHWLDRAASHSVENPTAARACLAAVFGMLDSSQLTELWEWDRNGTIPPPKIVRHVQLLG